MLLWQICQKMLGDDSASAALNNNVECVRHASSLNTIISF